MSRRRDGRADASNVLGTLIAMSVSTSARAVERVKMPDVAFDDLVRE